MCRVVRAGSKAAYQLLWDALYELKNPDLKLTHEQRRAKMKGFSGFGAYAKQIFPNPQTGQFDDPTWEKAGRLLEELLTKQEYASAKRTTPTAFYTSPLIMKEMWRAVERMGIKPGSVGLDPGCGIANFIGASPIPDLKMIGIEKDKLSAQIAQYLYPDADIRCEGIEESNLTGGCVDLAIGNAPFLDVKYSLHGKKHSLHDYCLLKSIDALRANGVVAMVTSRYTLDKVTKAGVETRKLIGKNADFLGAIRLPMDAFNDQGTNVVTDIVFFQKREHERGEGGPRDDLQKLWLNASKVELEGGEIYMNDYFRAHPEQVLGEMSVGHGMHNSEDLRVRSDGDLAAALHKAIDGLPENIVSERTEPLAVADDSYRLDPSLPVGVEENSLYIASDQTIMRVEGGQGTPLVTGSSKKPMKADGALGAQRLAKLIRLKEVARSVLDAQNNDLDKQARDKTRKKLLRLYKKFVQDHGPINKVTCSENRDGSLTRRTPNLLRFRKDPDVHLVRALEEYDERDGTSEPADIMKRDLVTKEALIESVESAKDGLIASLNHSGRVDLAYIAKLYKPDHPEIYAKQLVIEELGQLIFFDPILDTYITAEEYLSGNVRKKLAIAKESDDPRTRGNVEALVEAQPKDLNPEEIDVTLGTSWIPASDVKRFLVETLDLDTVEAGNLKVEYVPIEARWKVNYKGPLPGSAVSEFGMNAGRGRANAFKLTELALNQKMPKVYAEFKPKGAKKYPLDHAKTAVAKRKQTLLKQRFSDWAFQDAERSDRLCAYYNKTFNNIKDRDADGSHLTFPGMADHVTMRRHQKNAVWRNLSGGSTGFFHVVGSGKTFTMAATGMEMKRMGLINKPVYSVLNSTLDQFAKEFQTLYPNAKLLIATKDDFTAEGRRTLKARMLTGNYDAVIMAHSSFELMAMSPEYQEQFLAEEIEQYEEALKGIDDEIMHDNMIKKIEGMKIKREAKLKEMMEAGGKRDNDLYFDKLGIDYLFYDEAHKLKNLGVTTKMERVAGISTNTSQRALDALMKARYLQSKTPGRGITFATGTPVSNSLVELYTMMYFLVPDLLEERGVKHFDAWAANFGEVVNELEIRPDAKGHRVNARFADFTNLPELLSLFRTFADVQTQDMLKLDVPDFEVHDVVSPMTETEKEILEAISERYEKIRAGTVKPDEDNALAVVHAGRCLSLDVRMSMADAKENPDSKINKLVDRVYEIWLNTTEERSTQMVFSDLGVNPNDWGFCAYDEVIRKLVERGIPKDEIARVGDKNEALFAKLKSGQVRVVLGSTEKMGTGINAQDHLLAIHHLDCPWKPADLSQRDGRAIRQGNSNKKVDIYRYMTEGSFDAYMWQTVESKAKFIAKCMSGSINVRRTKDLGMSDAMSFANTKALASGNPAIMVMAKMLMELREQEMLLDGHKSEMRQVQRQLRTLPEEIGRHERKISSLKEDIARRAPTQGNAFSMTVGDRSFKHQAKHKKGESARQRAGAALGLAIAQGFKTIETSPRPCEMKLGAIGGFDVMLTIDKHEWKVKQPDVVRIELRGSGSYRVHTIDNPKEPSVDLVGYLERELKDMDGDLARISRMKETAEKDLATYKARDGAPFESMKLLETLRPLHATLEAIITSQAKDKEDSTGETVDIIIEAFDKLMDGQEVDAEQILQAYAQEEKKVVEPEASAETSDANPDQLGSEDAVQPRAQSGGGESSGMARSRSRGRARARGRSGGVGGIQTPAKRSGHDEASDAEPAKARAAGGAGRGRGGSSVISDLGHTRRRALRGEEHRRQAEDSSALDDASAEDLARQSRRAAKAKVRELEGQAEAKAGQRISLHELASALDDSQKPSPGRQENQTKLSFSNVYGLIRVELHDDDHEMSEDEAGRVLNLTQGVIELVERDANITGFWEMASLQAGVRSQLNAILLSPPSDIYVTERDDIINQVMGMAAVAAGVTPLNQDASQGGEQYTFTLTEVSRRANVSMPSLQSYKRRYANQIPSQGSGRHMRYSEESVAVFQQIHAERRGHPGKAAKASKIRIGLEGISTRTGIPVDILEAISVTNRDRFPVGSRTGEPRSWQYAIDAVPVFEELYREHGAEAAERVQQNALDSAVDETVGYLLASKAMDWSEHHIMWIGRFGKSAKRGEFNRQTLNSGAYRSDGGFERLNQMFGGRLEELMADFNATVTMLTEGKESDALYDEVLDTMDRHFDGDPYQLFSLAYRVREQVCANEGLMAHLDEANPSCRNLVMEEFKAAVADAVVDLGEEIGHENQMIRFCNDKNVTKGFQQLILEMVCTQTGIAMPTLNKDDPKVEQLGATEREALLSNLKEYFESDNEYADEDLVSFALLVRGWILGDEMVMLQVANNSVENALLGDFASTLDDAVLEVGKKYNEPMSQYLNDRAVVRGLQRVIMRSVKEHLEKGEEQVGVNKAATTQDRPGQQQSKAPEERGAVTGKDMDNYLEHVRGRSVEPRSDVSDAEDGRESDGNTADVIKQARELGENAFAYGIKKPEDDSGFRSLLAEAPEAVDGQLAKAWKAGNGTARLEDMAEKKRLADLDREERSRRKRGYEKQEMPSVKAARVKLWTHLKSQGWKMSRKDLLIQWAQHPESKTGTKNRARLWLHGAHSVWTGSQNAQSSLYSDIRGMPPESLVVLAERRFRRERRLVKVEQSAPAADSREVAAASVAVPVADPAADAFELDAREEQGLRALELEASSPADKALSEDNAAPDQVDDTTADQKLGKATELGRLAHANGISLPMRDMEFMALVEPYEGFNSSPPSDGVTAVALCEAWKAGLGEAKADATSTAKDTAKKQETPVKPASSTKEPRRTPPIVKVPVEDPKVWQTREERAANRGDLEEPAAVPAKGEPAKAEMAEDKTPHWGTDAHRQTFLDSFESPGNRPSRDAAWQRVSAALSTARDLKQKETSEIEARPDVAWNPVIDSVQEAEDREHEGLLELEREMAKQEAKSLAHGRQVEGQHGASHEPIAIDLGQVAEQEKPAKAPLYTLKELSETTKIALSTLESYVEQYGSRIPHVGSGPNVRYTAGAVTVVTKVWEFREQAASREASVDVRAPAQPEVAAELGATQAEHSEEPSAPVTLKGAKVGDLAVVCDSDKQHTLAEKLDDGAWHLQVLFLDSDVNRRVGLGWADDQWVEENHASEADVRRFRSHLSDDEFNLLPDSQRTAEIAPPAEVEPEPEAETAVEQPEISVKPVPTSVIAETLSAAIRTGRDIERAGMSSWDADEIENDLGEPQDLEGRDGIGMAMYRDHEGYMEDEIENDLGEPTDLEGQHGQMILFDQPPAQARIRPHDPSMVSPSLPKQPRHGQGILFDQAPAKARTRYVDALPAAAWEMRGQVPTVADSEDLVADHDGVDVLDLLPYPDELEAESARADQRDVQADKEATQAARDEAWFSLLETAAEADITYDDARKRIWNHLKDEGWTMSHPDLQTPWADSPDHYRLFFHPSSVHCNENPLRLDIRDVSPEDIVQAAENMLARAGERTYTYRELMDIKRERGEDAGPSLSGIVRD